MASETQHFGLTRLDPGEDIHTGDGAFPSADRDLIDQALYNAVFHHHTGDDFVDGSPQDPPGLVLSSTGGTLPAGTTISYAYTVTHPETGQSAASPFASVTTPDAITDPAAPTFSLQSIGGTLEPGQYFYVLTLYQTSSTVETKATNPVSIEIPVGTSTNEVTLTMPANPAGATGFNVYRRAPGQTQYYFLDSVTGASYVDGGVAETTRGLPTANTTNATYSVAVTIPGPIDVDSIWSLYRTYGADWTNSYLTTQDDSDLTYTDVGTSTTVGSPPVSAGAYGSPPKVLLTGAAEVQGVLPVANGGTGSSTDDTVKLTGDQTVAGVKTFTSSPVVPTPSTDFQAATKEYVDDLIGTIGGSDTDDVKLTGDQTVAGIKTFSSSPIVPTPTTASQAATKAYVDGAIVADDQTAAEVPITDAGGYFTATEVEGALQELGAGGGAGTTNLAWDAATSTVTSDTGTDATLTTAGANPGLMSAADKTKLDGIATGATVGYHSIVDHAANASVARPSVTGPVLWRGTIEPTNAINGDDWLDYT